MSGSNLRLNVIVSQLFEENAYIAHLQGREDCLLFDPGLDAQAIIDAIKAENLTPAAIINTHGHADHIAGNADVKQAWPESPLVIGRGDAPMLTEAELNLSAGYGFPLTSPPADKLLDEGDVYSAAGFDLEVLEIPGHSPGHVVFVWKGETPWVVFGGDVLFNGSIGRSDLPQGDHELLVAGIHSKLFRLPNDTTVLPGHGPATTIGQEKRGNPFVGAPAGYQE